MKKRRCKTCGSRFKTLEGKLSHKKRGIDKSDLDKLVLKNQNKYFIFFKTKEITRKHEYLYEMDQLKSEYFFANVKDNILKRNNYKMPSGLIKNKIKNESLSYLSDEEFDDFKKYLKRLNYEDSLIKKLRN